MPVSCVVPLQIHRVAFFSLKIFDFSIFLPRFWKGCSSAWASFAVVGMQQLQQQSCAEILLHLEVFPLCFTLKKNNHILSWKNTKENWDDKEDNLMLFCFFVVCTERNGIWSVFHFIFFFFFSLQVDHYLETYIDGEPCNGTFYPSSYSQSDSVFGSMCTDSTFYSF